MGLFVDDCYPVLPAHPGCAAVPAAWRRLPDPGPDPRRGVRPGAQVCAARSAEAVKTELDSLTKKVVCRR